MGLVIAVVFAAVIAAGAKDGVFKKGYDTTYRDTLTFEKHALEDKLSRTQDSVKQKKLQAKIAKIDQKLDRRG